MPHQKIVFFMQKYKARPVSRIGTFDHNNNDAKTKNRTELKRRTNAGPFTNISNIADIDDSSLSVLQFSPQLLYSLYLVPPPPPSPGCHGFFRVIFLCLKQKIYILSLSFKNKNKIRLFPLVSKKKYEYKNNKNNFFQMSEEGRKFTTELCITHFLTSRSLRALNTEKPLFLFWADLSFFASYPFLNCYAIPIWEILKHLFLNEISIKRKKILKDSQIPQSFKLPNHFYASTKLY